jgi:Fic family protein
MFKHSKLSLPKPSFDSELMDLILELESLRSKRLEGTTPIPIFFQLKRIFHMLESHGSARIEGNNTTIAEFIETKIEDRKAPNEKIQEIENIEKAMQYSEEYVEERGVSISLINDIHKKIVENLSLPPKGEGDFTPGVFRDKKVSITGSRHSPPENKFQVEGYMEELVAFINRNDSPKYDLLKVAIAHHRFMWVHPFTNGNGRTGRLLTYAMLINQGFSVNVGRILNPTAVFCFDRNQYNENLSLADNGDEIGIEKWCVYVLEGLKNEIKKIDNLADYEYLKEKILLPTLKFASDRKYITSPEYKILKLAVDKKSIQNQDIQGIFPKKLSAAISRMIRDLKKKKMLESEINNTRRYHISFANNFLIRGIIQMLEKELFIPPIN